MASLSEDSDVCAICLNELDTPVLLPCSHKYCLKCLEHWRPKHDIYSQRKCPQCRQTIPPTREMIADISSLRSSLHKIQDQLKSSEPLKLPNHFCSERIIRMPVDQQQASLRQALERRAARHIKRIEAFEDQYKNCKEVLDDSSSFEVLPFAIVLAVFDNDLKTILQWLGPPPVSHKRLHAKCLSFSDDTLLHMAAHAHNTSIMTALLEHGADVNTTNIHQFTPLFHSVSEPGTSDLAGRLLLQWGATKELPQFWNPSSDYLATLAEENGKSELAHLLQTPFGGRRCLFVGLKRDTDLNGKTAIVGQYFRHKDQYECVLEETQEQVVIHSINLKRYDYKPGNKVEKQATEVRSKDRTRKKKKIHFWCRKMK